MYRTKFGKWFFNKYFGIPKTANVFLVDDHNIHYYENGKCICRSYGQKISYWPSIGLLTTTNSILNKRAKISPGSADSNFGSGDIVCATSFGSLVYRSLIGLTMPSTPGGIISDIALVLTYRSNLNGPSTVQLYPLTQNGWTESGVTWNKYDGTNNWTVAGAMSDVGSLTHSLTNRTTAGTDKYYLYGSSCNGTALSNITWGSTVDLLLKWATESGSHDKEITYSGSDVGSAAVTHPYLETTYTLAATLAETLTMTAGLSMMGGKFLFLTETLTMTALGLKNIGFHLLTELFTLTSNVLGFIKYRPNSKSSSTFTYDEKGEDEI